MTLYAGGMLPATRRGHNPRRHHGGDRQTPYAGGILPATIHPRRHHGGDLPKSRPHSIIPAHRRLLCELYMNLAG
jgi:hypothetical protein